MRCHTICFVPLIVLAIAVPAIAEEPVDRWAPLRRLLGQWQGLGDGLGGESTVRHTYEFVIQGNFIRNTTHSEFQPKDDGTPGEVHEDQGFFSFDSDRGKIVFRQFLSEGFVNTYLLEDHESPTGDLVLTSESTESAGGMAARLTISFDGDDAYRMVLELASPGKDFFACQTLDMERLLED